MGAGQDIDIEFRVPAPITPDPKDQISAKAAIANPSIERGAFNHEYTNHPIKTIERLKAIPPGKNVWWEGLPDELKLNVKRAKLSQIYRRLSQDKPSYTVTGSGGGGTHVYHWSEPRVLTNRERARLQTFPDWYRFYGGKESVRKQIGMAVPPEAARIIIEAILKSFALVSYDHVDAKW